MERADPPDLAEWIAPLLEDNDSTIRMMTAAALMRKGDERGLAVVQLGLKSSDERERTWAEAMMAKKASLQ